MFIRYPLILLYCPLLHLDSFNEHGNHLVVDKELLSIPLCPDRVLRRLFKLSHYYIFDYNHAIDDCERSVDCCVSYFMHEITVKATS